MVSIAFERFCAVWLPRNNKTIFTHRKTFLLVLIIISFSTLLSTWFLSVVKHTDLSTTLLNKNETQLKCRVTNDSLYDSMGMLAVIMNYILPFIFVLLLNSTVIYRLCRRGIVELTSSITVMLTLVGIVHLCCTLPFQ